MSDLQAHTRVATTVAINTEHRWMGRANEVLMNSFTNSCDDAQLSWYQDIIAQCLPTWRREIFTGSPPSRSTKYRWETRMVRCNPKSWHCNSRFQLPGPLGRKRRLLARSCDVHTHQEQKHKPQEYRNTNLWAIKTMENKIVSHKFTRNRNCES